MGRKLAEKGRGVVGTRKINSNHIFRIVTVLAHNFTVKIQKYLLVF
jgi:hypothetical protein